LYVLFTFIVVFNYRKFATLIMQDINQSIFITPNGCTNTKTHTPWNIMIKTYRSLTDGCISHFTYCVQPSYLGRLSAQCTLLSTVIKWWNIITYEMSHSAAQYVACAMHAHNYRPSHITICN